MSLSAILTITQRELIRYARDKGRIFSTVIQSLMFLFVFGSGFRQTLAVGNFGVDFLQFMFPGIIALNIMGTAFFSTISTVWDREFGFLKEILVAPVSRTSIALGKTLGAVTIATAQACFILLLAPLIGLKLSVPILFMLVPVMVLLAFAIAGLGLLFASLVRTMENFGLVMNLLVFPMFFLSGAFFPLTSVPKWLAAVAAVNPLTYGVDIFRNIILRPQVSAEILGRYIVHPLATDVVFLLGFSAAMIGSAVFFFNKKA
jgi:ABC-2 type transport system permease protein